MLDIGFRPGHRTHPRRCPVQRQTLLLSATMPPPVLRLAQRYMHEPMHINLSPDRITVDNIRQYYFTVDPEQKFELLLRVLHREKPRQCIIFCERKRGADHSTATCASTASVSPRCTATCRNRSANRS